MEMDNNSDLRKKVEHVLSARQNRPHTCHWPGCTIQVPEAMWGCKPHWFTIPRRLRDRIWKTYRPGQENTLDPSPEYVRTARDVQDWITNHLEEKEQ